MHTAVQLAVNIAGIGDLILASKSLRAMKRSHPNTDLWLMTSTEAAVLAEHYPYIDRVISFPIRGFQNQPRCWRSIWKATQPIRSTYFDRCLNLYLVGSWLGALKMGFLFSLIHTPEKIGHDTFGFGRFVTKKVPADTFMKQHYVDAMGDIASLAGATPDGGGVDVFWDKSCEQPWRVFLEEQQSTLLLGVNPGGHRPNRRWNQEHFIETAQHLLKDYPSKIILFGSPLEETLVKYMESCLDNRQVINLAGKLNLHELCYLISSLDLLITNDSGPMHIAAATDTPVVGIFGPENPRHLRPYTKEKGYRVLYEQVPCRPCRKSSCDHPICLSLITPDRVFKACQELIESARVAKTSKQDFGDQ